MSRRDRDLQIASACAGFMVGALVYLGLGGWRAVAAFACGIGTIFILALATDA